MDSGSRLLISRRSLIKAAGASSVAMTSSAYGREARSPRPDVLAYYFPAWHQDPRQAEWHGAGWTEWKLLREARPRYAGHVQPKVPAWGEFDEADPRWSSKEIDLAADHGINGFIFDWYWYDGKPFLERALNEGFLQAPNRDKMKFCLMWANHDWLDLFPASPGSSRPLLARGAVDPAEFERVTDYVTQRFLSQPNYYRLASGLYFSIYELHTFLKGLGGVEGAKAALNSFRAKVAAAGLGTLHLNAVVWGVQVLPSENKLSDPTAVLRELGLSSLTTYAWVHNYEPGREGRFPRDSYAAAARASFAAWDKYAAAYGVPYHPNVSMGWDPSPRTTQGVAFRNYGYPWHAVLEGNTPQAYEAALRRARTFVERRPPDQRVITLNAWNEWTEGSYLLPDRQNGTAYLQAIRRVFGAGR